MTLVLDHLGYEDAFYKWEGHPHSFHNHIHVDGKPHGTGLPLCKGGHGPIPAGGWPYPNGSPFLVRAKAVIDAMTWPHVFHGGGYVCRPIDNDPKLGWSQHAFANALDLQADDWTTRFAILDPLWTWLHREYPGYLRYKAPLMKGPDVRQWKGRLMALGYTGMADDDVFGTGARNATLAFQTAAKIADDGVVGPITRRLAFGAH